MHFYYIVVQFAGEYGHKADALIKLSKDDSNYWNWTTVSDDDKILSLVKSKQNFMSYLNISDLKSAIRKDGGDKYYKVFEADNMDEDIFKADPYNWEDNLAIA